MKQNDRKHIFNELKRMPLCLLQCVIRGMWCIACRLISNIFHGKIEEIKDKIVGVLNLYVICENRKCHIFSAMMTEVEYLNRMMKRIMFTRKS